MFCLWHKKDFGGEKMEHNQYQHQYNRKNFFLVIGIILIWTMLSIHCRKIQMQKDISDAVIRFHVIANSDSDKDQAVKLKVRNEILADMQAVMEQAETKEEAERILSSQLDHLTETANRVLSTEGMDYKANVVLERTKFPVKTYGDLTFPAGDYEAVRVLLGNGTGHNWWCVMFPTLCLLDGTCETVPENSKKKLKDSLTEKEYNSLLTAEHNGIKYEYRFRIKEWFSKTFS